MSTDNSSSVDGARRMHMPLCVSRLPVRSSTQHLPGEAPVRR
jgi:hypothetical protein